jgi:hypothetical protein
MRNLLGAVFFFSLFLFQDHFRAVLVLVIKTNRLVFSSFRANFSAVFDGITVAKKQLTAIFNLTQVVLDMQSVHKLGNFLYVVVSEVSN